MARVTLAPSCPDDWQAQDDLRTLMSGEEIETSAGRRKQALRVAKYSITQLQAFVDDEDNEDNENDIAAQGYRVL